MFLSNNVILMINQRQIKHIKELKIKCSDSDDSLFAETISTDNSTKIYKIENLNTIGKKIYIGLIDTNYLK